MKSVVCTKLGFPPEISVQDEADPVHSEGEVLIKVHAAGVNFPDVLLVQGLYQIRPEPPFTPGIELAGVVEKVGARSRFSVGDRVMVFTGHGAFREKVCVSEELCSLVPKSMPLKTAAGFVTTYCTTLHAIDDRARLRAGETLLVLGAAGGVGSAAIEIGKALGARVIAVAKGKDKLDYCRSLGAHDVIDYSTDDLKTKAKALGPIDVVYDAVGGSYSEAALRALRPNGRFLVIGFASGTIPKIPLNLPLLKECAIIGVQWGAMAMREPAQQQSLLNRLGTLWSVGALSPKIYKEYSLEETSTALQDLADRKVVGKAIIVMPAASSE